jgi:uncharacterized protein YqgV (UPF0045/DUF77 family)
MKTSIDISYYPLEETYKVPIKAFIKRLRTHEHILVRTNGMSTQVFGEYDDVMGAITKEIKVSFEVPHSIFILKVINSDLQEIPDLG